MRYLALLLDKVEVRRKGLSDIVPKKRAKKGKKATVRTVLDDETDQR